MAVNYKQIREAFLLKEQKIDRLSYKNTLAKTGQRSQAFGIAVQKSYY